MATNSPLYDEILTALNFQQHDMTSTQSALLVRVKSTVEALSIHQLKTFRDAWHSILQADVDEPLAALQDLIRHYKLDDNGHVTIEFPASKEITEIPWNKRFIHDVILLVPDTKPNPNAGTNRVEPWSFQAWSNLLKDLSDGNLGKHIEYYGALNYVTARFGDPSKAGFNVYIRHRKQISPPSLPGTQESIHYNTHAMTIDDAAAYGYATWILGVRFAIRGTQLDLNALPSAFKSITSWFHGIREDLLAGLVIEFFNQTKGFFGSGTTICASECVIRRGMNINPSTESFFLMNADQKQITVDQNTYQLVKGEGENGVTLIVGSEGAKYFFDTTMMQNYNGGFWGFAQVGIANHGYALMSMFLEGAKKTGITIPMILRLWPNNQMAEMQKVYIQESVLCNRDPWRCVGHLLRNNIFCPLSMTKYQECAYAGLCLCKENLSVLDRPLAPSGINLTLIRQVYIAAIITLIRSQFTSAAITENPELAKEFAPETDAERRMRSTLASFQEQFKEEMSSENIIQEILKTAREEIIRLGKKDEEAYAPLTGSSRRQASFLLRDRVRVPRTEPTREEADKHSEGEESDDDDQEQNNDYQDETTYLDAPKPLSIEDMLSGN